MFFKYIVFLIFIDYGGFFCKSSFCIIVEVIYCIGVYKG